MQSDSLNQFLNLNKYLLLYRICMASGVNIFLSFCIEMTRMRIQANNVLYLILEFWIHKLTVLFAIAFSRKLDTDSLHAWTRNPMVLTAIDFLQSLGIWFQSVLEILWGLIVYTPALLMFVQVYEERELEIRFGASFLEYKSKTSMLFPRKPRIRH